MPALRGVREERGSHSYGTFVSSKDGPPVHYPLSGVVEEKKGQSDFSDWPFVIDAVVPSFATEPKLGAASVNMVPALSREFIHGASNYFSRLASVHLDDDRHKAGHVREVQHDHVKGDRPRTPGFHPAHNLRIQIACHLHQ